MVWCGVRFWFAYVVWGAVSCRGGRGNEEYFVLFVAVMLFMLKWMEAVDGCCACYEVE